MYYRVRFGKGTAKDAYLSCGFGDDTNVSEAPGGRSRLYNKIAA